MLQTTTTAAYFLSPPSLSLSCTLYGKSDHIHTHKIIIIMEKRLFQIVGGGIQLLLQIISIVLCKG